jgi:hypothetical protein
VIPLEAPPLPPAQPGPHGETARSSRIHREAQSRRDARTIDPEPSSADLPSEGADAIAVPRSALVEIALAAYNSTGVTPALERTKHQLSPNGTTGGTNPRAQPPPASLSSNVRTGSGSEAGSSDSTMGAPGQRTLLQ